MAIYQEVKKPTGKFKVKFLPNNVEIDVFKEGENLLKIAMAAGIHINASCGGIGACGKCKVKIIGTNYIGGKSPKLSEDEIIQFIFKDEFSTAKEVTEISGRGVGLSSVLTELKKINGNIQIDNRLGEGITFTFSFNLV